MRLAYSTALLALVASLSPRAWAQAQPHRSANELVSSNGRAVVGFDVSQKRITAFLEHPYRQRSNGAETRDVAFDVYPGVRVGSSGKWLGEVAPSSAGYETGTGIIRVTRSHAGLEIDEYIFSPIDLPEHAFVNLVRVKRLSGSGGVHVYGLFNFHLGAGSPVPTSAQETISWDATRDAFLEWGPSGLTLAYGSIGASAHHAASPQNPYPALNAGQNLADNAGTGGAFDDAVGGLQWSLGDIAVGDTKWSGSYVVLDDKSNVTPRIDAVKTWIGTKTPDQILAAEKAAWAGWHTPVPSGLGLTEDPLYRQQMAILRMGQVHDAGVLAPPHPPHVQVAQLRCTRQCGDDLAHFLHHRRIHFGIEQHPTCVAQQSDRPAPDQHGADDPHHRVEPGRTEVFAAREGDDRQHGRSGIRHDVQVRRAQVQVVMVGVAIVAVRVMVVAVM